MSTVNGFQVGSETLKYNYESLDNYNTPNFSTSSSVTYAVGDYVMYNGKLYKCTTATTGGTWVNDNWTEAVLAEDVSDLSRQLSDVESALNTLDEIVLPETSDKYHSDISCAAGIGIVSSVNQLSVTIPQGAKYKITFEDKDGCLAASAIINVYENILNESSGTVTYSISANETYEKTATKNIGWLSVYITGSAIVSSGVIKLIVETNYGVNENSLVIRTETLESSTEEIKNELSVVDSVIYSINATEKHNKTISIPSTSILASVHVFDVEIAKWQIFSFEANFEGQKYAIYADGSLLFTELLPNTKYYFQATKNISYLSIYSNTISDNSIDFTLELLEYRPYGGIEYANERIDQIKNGYVTIPYLDMVGQYNPDETGVHTATGDEYHTNIMSVKPGEEINVSLIYEDKTEAVQITVMLYDTNKEFIERRNVNISAIGSYNGVYVIPANAYYVSFQYLSRSGCKFTLSQRVNIDGFILPPYYNVNDYIQNKIIAIANAIANAHGNYDVFIFNTDQHWTLNAKNSPKLIHYICDCIPVKKLFLGGDLNDGIDLQASKAFVDAFDGDKYNLIGNHEFMNYVFNLNGAGLYTDVTDSLICAYYGTRLTNVNFGNAERQYYYIDDDTRKMRYIVLSVFTDDGQFAKYQFETEQQSWLSNDALNLPSGYTAVILTHALYRVEYGTGEMTIIDETLQPIIDIINQYNGNGEIACVFVGHMHLDGMKTLSNGVPVFVTTCDKYEAFISDGVNTEPWLSEYRQLGTITEQAFDVVVVDKQNKRISAIRVGAPAYDGNDFNLEIRTATYS